MIVNGFDCSSMQGTLTAAHFAALKAVGVEFMIHRCGVGNDYADPNWKTNVALATTAGIVVGLYHFIYFIPVVPGHASRSPEAQADYHWSFCQGVAAKAGVDLPTFTDWEWPSDGDWSTWGSSPSLIQDYIPRYNARYLANSGRRTGGYTYPWWSKAAGLASIPNLSAVPLWQAGPYVQTVPTSMPAPIAPWTSVSINQYTGGKSGTPLPNGAPVDWDCCEDTALASLVSYV